MFKHFGPFCKIINSYTHIDRSINRVCRGQNCLQSIIMCATAKQYSCKIPSSDINMSVLKLTDYDCIGFDLDNTLLRYNLTNMVHLEYSILAKFLVEERGYNPKYLLKPLKDEDLDFMQKGLVLDFDRGNILRLSPDGIIRRACHGSRLLTIDEIKKIYPSQRWEITDIFCKDMLATWNEPLSMKMRSLLDYFDLPSSIIFARAVDTLDDEHGKELGTYNIWSDMLDGLIDMFEKGQFKANEGYYFPALKDNPGKYLRKCSPETIAWLGEIKKNKKTFLLTGSYIDFAQFTASYALGEDWRTLFDITVCYAKKPGFFVNNRPFLKIVDDIESDAISGQDLKKGEVYSQGNWKELMEFFSSQLKKQELHCLYIGDNLIQDIYVPNAYVQCDTVAVVEEQMSEGMLHQGLIHPDEKILNSMFWGSYFCLKDSKTNVDSLWGHIIKNYAKICIPEIELLAQHPLNKAFTCFNKSQEKYFGYYPAVPLSISLA